MSIAEKIHDCIPGYISIPSGMGLISILEFISHNPNQLKYGAADMSIGAGLIGGLSNNPGYSILGWGLANAGPIGDMVHDLVTYGSDISFTDSIEKLAVRLGLFGGSYILGALVGRAGD